MKRKISVLEILIGAPIFATSTTLLNLFVFDNIWEDGVSHSVYQVGSIAAFAITLILAAKKQP